MAVTSYFFMFIVYSFIGWICEMGWERVFNHRFINRGFLIGPYCPIYGFGGLLITILLRPFEDNPLILFLSAMVICACLEYVTSILMDKIFKARWWDYSNFKFNINGRICLETMIPFGLLGLFVIYICYPTFITFFNYIGTSALNFISILLFSLFLFDLIVSVRIIISLKINDITKDNTDTISSKVKEIILSKFL